MPGTFQHQRASVGGPACAVGSCLGSPTWSCTGGRGWATMLTLSYLIARCAGSIWRASRWQRQVTSWGWGQAPRGGGGHLCPLQSHVWDYRARRVVLMAPEWSPGEGESLVDPSPEAPLSQGAVQDRSAGTPQRAPSLLLAAEEIEAQGKQGPWVSALGEEPRPPGSQAGYLSTGAAPLQLHGSPATLGFCFPPGGGQSGSDRPVVLELGFRFWPGAPGGLGHGSGM